MPLFGHSTTLTSPSTGNSGGLYDNNPYVGRTYNKSGWQKFLGKLGFRSPADQWLEDMQMQAAEYDAGIAQKMNDREYDDPANQVMRQRAAGLNPDLDGGSNIGTGDPGVSPEDTSNPSIPGADDLTPIMQVADFSLSLVTSAIEGAAGLAGLVGDVAGKFIANRNAKISGANEELSGLTDFMDKTFTYPADAGPDAYTPAAEAYARDFPSYYRALTGRRLSAKSAERASRFASDYLHSFRTRFGQARDKNETYEQDIRSAVNNESSYNPYKFTYSGDAGDLGSLQVAQYKVIADIEDVVRKSTLELQKLKIGNATDYEEKIDRTGEALADNASNVSRQASAEYNTAVTGKLSPSDEADARNMGNQNAAIAYKMQRDIQKVLDGHADRLIKDGNWLKRSFGYTLKAGALKLLSWTASSSLMNVSASQSESNSWKDGKQAGSLGFGSSFSLGL